MRVIEKRKSKRMAAEFEINYVHEDDYVISYSTNISADGMFFHTEKLPEQGSKIKITFSIEDSDPFTVTSEVVWVNDTGEKKDHGIGVRFIDPAQELQEAIVKFINRVAIFGNN